MRGSDDCFAQIAGTYLNEERTGGGAPLVEGYSRRRVCSTYRVCDQSLLICGFKGDAFSQSKIDDRTTMLNSRSRVKLKCPFQDLIIVVYLILHVLTLHIYRDI